MRKILCVLSLAATAALATPALAQPVDYYTPDTAALATGAAVGTVAGVGLYNGWWGNSTFVASLPTTAAGAAVAGGVAGVGTVVLIDAIFQPCRGFHALLGLNHGACADGEYVGDAARPRHRISRR